MCYLDERYRPLQRLARYRVKVVGQEMPYPWAKGPSQAQLPSTVAALPSWGRLEIQRVALGQILTRCLNDPNRIVEQLWLDSPMVRSRPAPVPAKEIEDVGRIVG